jgi:hypothetical protein
MGVFIPWKLGNAPNKDFPHRKPVVKHLPPLIWVRLCKLGKMESCGAVEVLRRMYKGYAEPGHPCAECSGLIAECPGLQGCSGEVLPDQEHDREGRKAQHGTE